MAAIVLTLSDAHVDRVIEGLGWPNVANQGESKTQFAKRRIIEMVKHEVFQFELAKLRAAQVVNTVDLT